MGCHLGTLHGYFFHQDFWPNLNFLLEDQIKVVLKRSGFTFGLASVFKLEVDDLCKQDNLFQLQPFPLHL